MVANDRLTFRLPKQLKKEIEAYCKAKAVTPSWLMRRCWQEFKKQGGNVKL
jgi:hypothetical protein